MDGQQGDKQQGDKETSFDKIGMFDMAVYRWRDQLVVLKWLKDDELWWLGLLDVVSEATSVPLAYREVPSDTAWLWREVVRDAETKQLRLGRRTIEIEPSDLELVAENYDEWRIDLRFREIMAGLDLSFDWQGTDFSTREA